MALVAARVVVLDVMGVEAGGVSSKGGKTETSRRDGWMDDKFWLLICEYFLDHVRFV